VKFETAIMHVIKTQRLTLTTKEPLDASNYIDSNCSDESYKLLTFISEHVLKVFTTMHAHMISDGRAWVNRCSVDNVLFKSKPSLHQALSQVINVIKVHFV